MTTATCIKVNSLGKRIHVQYVLAASETVNRHSLFTYRTPKTISTKYLNAFWPASTLPFSRRVNSRTQTCFEQYLRNVCCCTVQCLHATVNISNICRCWCDVGTSEIGNGHKSMKSLKPLVRCGHDDVWCLCVLVTVVYVQ